MIPHLAFPFHVTNGVFDTVDQDSPDHLAQRILLTVSTRHGDRLEDPDFGIPDHLLRTQGVDLDALRAALLDSEPDAAPIVERVDALTDVQHVDTIRLLIEEDLS